MLTVDANTATGASAPVQAHAVPLPGGACQVWRSACVRGAGFPASVLGELAAPAAAQAAESWLAADERLAAARAERRRLRKTRDAAIRRGEDAGAAGLDQRLREAEAEAARARAAFERTLETETARISAFLRGIVVDPRFREAVLWQNRRAVRTAFEPLRRPAGRNGSDRAAKERLVASYLQRYCVKNDTIGFFGPVAWAHLADDGPAVRIAPGPRLVAARAVHFETWAIEALAEAFAGRAALRPWCAPRLLPQVHVTGSTLVIPGRDPVVLGPAQARLLTLCDGRRSAREIARELAADAGAGFADATAVQALLEAFRQMGLVLWTIELPLERDPERRLRALLAGVDDEGVRTPCVTALDELESRRAEVALAAGQPEALDRALASLDETFTRLTGVAATRSPGEMYAARTLVYEECRRDISIVFGPALLDRLGPALSLVVESARWCTSQVAAAYRIRLGAALEAVRARTGSRTPQLGAVLAEGFDLGPRGELPPPVAGVHAELRRRWTSVLAFDPAERHVRRASADLRPRAAAAFRAPAPGWAWARHVSPDVMIAADGIEAIGRGDCTIVLGELHLMNSLLQTALAAEHPDPAELQRALDADFLQPAVIPVQGRETFTDRTAIGVRPSRSWWFESSREIAPGDRAGVLRAADLVAEDDREGLWIATRDGRLRFDAVDFLGYFLALRCVSMFGMLPDAPHMPRVSIDDVVVSRERWQAAAGSLDWAGAPAAPDRFAGARRWAAAAGIPRFAFVRTPAERKPCYVDFESPIYVDILAKLARKSAAASPMAPITITEMLPGPDRLWLADAEGRRYTSEVRLVVVDGGACP